MADILGNNFIIDIPRLVSIHDPGFYYDIVPGKYPGNWTRNNIRFWDTGTQADLESTTFSWGEVEHKDLTNSIVTLLPAPEHLDWGTLGTGPYVRRRLSEFDVPEGIGGGAWFEWPYLHSSDWVFTSKANPSMLVSKFFIQRSAGIVFDFCVYGPYLENGPVVEVWFGSQDATRIYKLTVNMDGRGFLTRGTNETEEAAIAKGYLFPSRSETLKRWHRIYLLPHGRSRILIATSSGRQFIYEDKTIKRDLGGKTIDEYLPHVTERAKYSIRFSARGAIRTNGIAYTGTPDSSSGTAKIKGYIELRNDRLISIPRLFGAETIQTVSDYDRPPALLVAGQPVIVSNFISSNAGEQAKIQTRITLQRRDISDEDMYQTPILYRSELFVDPVHQIKPDESQEIYVAVMDPKFSVQDGRLSGSVTIKDIKDYPFYRRRFNIPFRYTDDENHVFEGILSAPKPKQSGTIIDQEWSLIDYLQWMEKTPVYDLKRLDGYTVSDAVKAILVACGFPNDGSYWNITETPLTTVESKPTTKLSKGEADSDAVNLSDVLKTPKEWLDYLCDTYTSSARYPYKWVYGFMPFLDPILHKLRYKFYFLDPATFTDTPDYTLYPTEAQAVNHGVTQVNAYKNVYLVEDEEVIEPEGNAVLGIGLDANENTIMKYVENRNSIDTSVPPNDRETAWLGDRRVVILEDPALNTPELVNAAVMILYQRVKTPLLVWRISMQEWNPNILPWMMLRLYAYRDDRVTLEYRDWRVTGIEVDASHAGPYPYRRRTTTLTLTTPYVNRNGTAE